MLPTGDTHSNIFGIHLIVCFDKMDKESGMINLTIYKGRLQRGD